MKLWLLRPRKDHGMAEDPWVDWYDKMFGFVVRAETEDDARKLAATRPGEEGKNAWLIRSYSTCVELTCDGPPEIIICDYMRA